MTTKKKTTGSQAKAKAGAKQADTTRNNRSRKAATAVADATATHANPSVISVTIAPPQPEMAPIETQSAPQAPAAASNAKKPLTIGMFQKRLHELGYYGGHWDGIYGPLTRDAVCRFQAHSNLPVNGDATPETIKRMGLVG